MMLPDFAILNRIMATDKVFGAAAALDIAYSFVSLTKIDYVR